jgi:hypothetical protein
MPGSYPWANIIGYAAPPPGPLLTDWLQGWGTAIGSLLSGLGVLLTYRLLRFEVRKHNAERETADRERKDAEAAQAHLIFPRVTFRSDDNGTTLIARVMNNSEKPTHAPSLFVGNDPDIIPLYFSVDGVLRPGQELEQRLRLPAGVPMSMATATVEFTDAAGLTWIRVSGQPPMRGLFVHPMIRAAAEAVDARPRPAGRLVARRWRTSVIAGAEVVIMLMILGG